MEQESLSTEDRLIDDLVINQSLEAINGTGLDEECFKSQNNRKIFKKMQSYSEKGEAFDRVLLTQGEDTPTKKHLLEINNGGLSVNTELAKTYAREIVAGHKKELVKKYTKELTDGLERAKNKSDFLQSELAASLMRRIRENSNEDSEKLLLDAGSDSEKNRYKSEIG